MPKGIRKNKVAEELEQQVGGVAVAEEHPVIEDKIQLPTDDSHVNEDYKIHVIKDYDGKVDAFYLSKKDPRYDYRWLNSAQENLSRRTGNMLFQGEGWQLCERDHLKRIGIKENFISPDGFYRMGDLVLSFIPKEYAAQKAAHKEKKAKDRASQIERLLKDGDRGGVYGAGGIHESMKGIQTQKELGIT